MVSVEEKSADWEHVHHHDRIQHKPHLVAQKDMEYINHSEQEDKECKPIAQMYQEHVKHEHWNQRKKHNEWMWHERIHSDHARRIRSDCDRRRQEQLECAAQMQREQERARIHQEEELEEQQQWQAFSRAYDEQGRTNACEEEESKIEMEQDIVIMERDLSNIFNEHEHGHDAAQIPCYQIDHDQIIAPIAITHSQIIAPIVIGQPRCWAIKKCHR
jgi:hypothetical protein